MKQEDYDKINEALKPLFDRINILVNGAGYGQTDSSEEDRQSNPELKKNIREEQQYTVLIIACIATSVFLVIIITLLYPLFDYFKLNAFHTALLVICQFAGILGAFIISNKKQKLHEANKAKYDTDIVQKALHEVLPNAICRPATFISPARLYHLGVVPQYTNARGSYLIEYNKNGQKCLISNLTLTYETEDNEGHTKSKMVFSGQAYILEYRSNVPGNVRIMTSSNNNLLHKTKLDGFKKRERDEERIETENMEFNHNFEVYASDEHTAFYCLSPYVMEQLLAMKKTYGKFGVAITGSVISIALNSNFSLFQMPFLKGEVDNMSVNNSKRELQKVLSFAQKIEDSINGRIRG